MRSFRVLAALFMVLCLAGQVSAQTTEIIAPNVFLQGLVLPAGVRYTATFMKPEDAQPLRNISVEITLPPGAQFSQMLVPPQVEYDVVRVSREGAITMIWQTSRVPGENTLDSYSFTLAQPLTAETEFYIEWQDDDGSQHYESFFELPPLALATQNTGIATLSDEAFLPAGETGVQVSVPQQPEPVTLTVNVLPADFNPPPEYGDLWWCSLIEIDGLPEGVSANVIVPLRRPIAPFTPLSLFRQNEDGSWSSLEGQAFVTADGQYVVYEHPGGAVATGGPTTIQPELIAAANIQAITDAGLVAPASTTPDLTTITDGTSNTILVNEIPALPPPAPISDGTSNITDGTSNTVQISELPPANPITDGTSNITDGTSNTVQFEEVQPPPAISDGTSNTIQLEEVVVPPAITDGTSNITDGTSNTVFLGELPQPTEVSSEDTNQVTDGSSNTILIGEASPTPTVQTPPITDGSSNTILPGESTPTAIQPSPTLSTVSDGTSNTIIVGEATPTIIVISNSPGATPSASQPTPTISAISDGSSNTVIIGETTPVPATSTAAPTATPNLPRVVVLDPTPIANRQVISRIAQVNTPRVEIYTQVSFAPVQCQLGRINCVLLLRRVGGGFR